METYLAENAGALGWRKSAEIEFEMRRDGLAKMINLYPSYFTFTFVRNPFDRMVSIWRHSERTLAKNGDNPYAQRPQRGLSFKEYVNLIKRGDPQQLSQFDIYHSRPQVDFVLDYNRFRYFGVWRKRWSRCGFIGRFETLQQDFDTLCLQLGIPRSPLPHRNNSHNNAHYSHYYDPETIATVSKIYAQDIRRFNYRFESVPQTRALVPSGGLNN